MQEEGVINEEALALRQVLQNIVGIANDNQLNRFEMHGGIHTAEDMVYIDVKTILDIRTLGSHSVSPCWWRKLYRALCRIYQVGNECTVKNWLTTSKETHYTFSPRCIFTCDNTHAIRNLVEGAPEDLPGHLP